MSMHTYRPLDKMDFSKMIDIGFSVRGSASWLSYSAIVNRINRFNDVEVIGVDSTNTYNIHKIEMGTKGKPIIMLMAGTHGTEYQGVLYTIGILEDLENNTFPDKSFRDRLLRDFHIIGIPMANPWGVQNTTPYAIIQGRSNGVERNINRDFAPFTLPESTAIKKHMDNPEIFAFNDNHLLRTYARPKEEVTFVGNGQRATDDIRNYIVDCMNAGLPKKSVRWEAYENMTRGITRRYMRDKMNKHTEFTLSYTIEVARPVNETSANGGTQRPFSSDEELYEYGYKVTYLFLKTSVAYFDAYKGTGLHPQASESQELEIKKIVAPNREVTFKRNKEGEITSTDEKYTDGRYKGQTIVSEIDRNETGLTKSITKSLKR